MNKNDTTHRNVTFYGIYLFMLSTRFGEKGEKGLAPKIFSEIKKLLSKEFIYNYESNVKCWNRISVGRRKMFSDQSLFNWSYIYYISEVDSYQNLKKVYLMPSCLTQHYKVRIKGKCGAQEKGVAPFPTSQFFLKRYWKASHRVALDYDRPTICQIYKYAIWKNKIYNDNSCSLWQVNTIYEHLLLIKRLIALVGRVFANGPGDLSSIPGRVIPKTLNMVLDSSLLNTQQYKVHIKGKVEHSRERSSALPYTSVY